MDREQEGREKLSNIQSTCSILVGIVLPECFGSNVSIVV